MTIFGCIERVSSKLDGLQNNNREVVAALKDLSNKVAQLESRQNEPCQERKQTCIKVPLYIWVSMLVCMCYIRFLHCFAEHMISSVSDFLFSFSGIPNQDISFSIAREVKIRTHQQKRKKSSVTHAINL